MQTIVKDFKKNAELLLLCLPAIVKILVFSYLPMIGILIAFQDYRAADGLFYSQWVGFENFEFFFKSVDAWRVTRNTIGLNFIFIVTGIVVSVGVAILLYEISGKIMRRYYQSILFFPYFISWILASQMLLTLIGARSGLLNIMIHNLGWDKIDFYTNPVYWPFILTLVNLWKSTGYYALIYYAVLTGIDREFFEAAKIDGASRLQTIRHITLPFLKPMIIIMAILSIGGIMRADFGLFFFVPLDQGMLYPATDVIDTYIFRALREMGDFGMSTAVGLFQSMVGLILVIVTNWAAKKHDSSQGLF